MIDDCDKHGERARKLLAAWNAMFPSARSDRPEALTFSISEKGYVIHFRGGGGGYKGETLDAAFDDMERSIRAAAAEEVGFRREALDNVMAAARAVEAALA